jgi:xanthine dehydrogenase accessory factor
MAASSAPDRGARRRAGHGGATAALVLAAGTSSRMGRPKALVPVGGERMIDRTLSNLRAGGVDEIVVVLGHRAAEVRAAVDFGDAAVVEAPDYRDGMSSSLRAGIHAVASGAEFLMIVLADQPFVRPETFRHLVEHAGAGDGAIFVPTYKGVWGNPVVFARSFAPEIEKLRGEVGCRAIFPDHAGEIREVPVDDPGTLVDIDTEEELLAVDQAIARGGDLPELLDRLSEARWSLHAEPSDHPVPKRLHRRVDVPALAHELRGQGVPFALATVVRAVRPTSGKPGYQAIVREDGSHVGWVGGACTEHLLVREALAALAAGAPRLLRVVPDPASLPAEEGVVNLAMTCQSGGSVEIFIEPNRPKPTLLVIGDSPVATSLAALGPMLGYRVALVAPGADAAELPEVDRVVTDLDAIPSLLSASTFAVVASMGKYDEAALAPIVRSPAPFVGLVASRKRAQSVFATLRDDGATEVEVARIRNPVGIDVSASTPEEIALSIMAEITKERRTRPASAPPPAAPEVSPTEAVDPVCHMTVETTSALHAAHAGTTYYFCADACRRAFRSDPAKYLAST